MLKPRSRFFVISGLFPLFESRSAGGLSGVLAHSELLDNTASPSDVVRSLTCSLR